MTPQPYILTVTLNPAVDQFVAIDQEIRSFAGGKGINVARALKKLNLRTKALILVGGNTGKAIQAFLDKEKIECIPVLIRGNSRTNLSIVQPKDHAVTRVLEKGPTISSAEQKQFLKKYTQCLKNCRAVVLSGRLPPGLRNDFYQALIKLAHDNHVITVLDTSGTALKYGIKAMPFMVKPNFDEAKDVLHLRLQTKANIKKALKRLHALGAKNILLTNAEHGLFGLDGHDIWKVSSPRQGKSHQVGCGDAAVAGFLYAYFRRKPFAQQARMAAAAGAASVRQLPPGAIKRRDVLSIYQKTKVIKF